MVPTAQYDLHVDGAFSIQGTGRVRRGLGINL